MKMKCLIFATVLALLSVGCSDKKDVPDDLNKQKEEKNAVLEGGNNAIEPMPREPEYRTKGCLQGCKGLPCNEAARCVMRNCPGVRIKCEL